MKILDTPYLVLLIILGSITITTVIADTVTINTYPYTLQDTSANQRFVIASSGIGIGTTSPVGLLNIAPSGNYGGRQLALQNWADLSSVGGGEGLFASNAYLNNTDNSVRFSNTHSTIGSTGFAVNYPTWNSAGIFVNIGPSTAGQKVTPNWVATFTPTGVGIGTTSPVGLLNIAPSGNYGGRQLALQNWADLSSVGGGEGLFASNAYLNNTDNSVRFSNTHSTIGSTGFAVNYPTWNSAGIFVNIGPSTAGQKVTPNWVATFTPTGVGIGTTSPAQPLDVNGNIRLTGNIVSPNDICIGNC